jgi:hypothetical protein
VTAHEQAGEPRSADRARAAAVGRDHFGFDSATMVGVPGAVCASSEGRAIAVVDEATMTVVGGVLLWAERAGVGLEALIVPERDRVGVVAGWLEGFASPPVVRGLTGRELFSPGPAPESAAPIPPVVPAEFEAADVEVVIENGMVLAEVDGLEVARVLIDADGRERVAVGVGRYDRAAHDVMSAEMPLAERLATVVEGVRAVRRPVAAAHNLNRLCRERWLRAVLVAEPGPVGLVELRPADPIPPRESLLDRGPAPAVGTDAAGAKVLVMATAGIDPSVTVATSAVARREEPDRIVVALPPRDLIRPTERLLATLRWPVKSFPMDPPWG